MRNTLLIIALMSLGVAAAAQSRELPPPAKPSHPAKLLPLKSGAANNSCASYGPGFVKVAGTDTCVHIGGSLEVTGGMSGAR